MDYQHVNLIFDPEAKVLSLKLPEPAIRINPALRGLFSHLTQEISGNLHSILNGVVRIRETPSYKKLVDSLSIRLKSETGEYVLKSITLGNLEIYIVFALALKINKGRRLIAYLLRKLLGLETHLKILHYGLIVEHEVDSGLFIAQFQNLTRFLPRFCRYLLGLHHLESMLSKLHMRRVWYMERRIPLFFKDQFPTVVLKTKKNEVSNQTDGGGGGGYKNDKTPLKTRPGRD